MPDRTQRRRPAIERFWEKVDKSGDCWIWTAYKSPAGYGSFGVRAGESPQLAHRVSYRMTHGDIPEGMQVLHSCDNPPCVRPEHLSLGTGLDNVRDMFSKGRQPKHSGTRTGERNSNSKFTNAQRAVFLAELERGERLYIVARKYGVKYDTLFDMWRRQGRKRVRLKATKPERAVGRG